MGAGLVHLEFTPSSWTWWGYGLFFLLTGIGQIVYAAAVVRWPNAGVLWLGIVGNLGIVGLYLMTRTNGIPAGPSAGHIERVGQGDFITTAGRVRPGRDAGRGPRAAVAQLVHDAGGPGRRRPLGPAPHGHHPLMRRPSLFGALAGVVVVLLGVKWFVAEPFSVPARSMAPTLEPGDHVLVNKLAYRTGDPQRGDLAVVKAPRTGELLLKRVVGVGGDEVEIRDGVLYVNGRAPREPYVDHDASDSVYFGPVEVPAGRLFVLGDNRANSDDSRQLGPVAADDAIGRVDLRVWPL